MSLPQIGAEGGFKETDVPLHVYVFAGVLWFCVCLWGVEYVCIWISCQCLFSGIAADCLEQLCVGACTSYFGLSCDATVAAFWCSASPSPLKDSWDVGKAVNQTGPALHTSWCSRKMVVRGIIILVGHFFWGGGTRAHSHNYVNMCIQIVFIFNFNCLIFFSVVAGEVCVCVYVYMCVCVSTSVLCY